MFYTLQEFQQRYGRVGGSREWEKAGAQEPGAFRRANDGKFYTLQEFQDWYGFVEGSREWKKASAHEPAAAARLKGCSSGVEGAAAAAAATQRGPGAAAATTGTPLEGFLLYKAPAAWRTHLGVHLGSWSRMVQTLPEDPTGRLSELKLMLVRVETLEEALNIWSTRHHAAMPLRRH